MADSCVGSLLVPEPLDFLRLPFCQSNALRHLQVKIPDQLWQDQTHL